MFFGGVRMTNTAPYFTGPFAPMCELFVKQRRIAGALYESRAKVLRRFDNFCKDYDVRDYELTEELILAYSVRRPNEADNTRRERLSTVRSFAEFLAGQGYASYVSIEIPKRTSQHVPYIFTKEELKRLFERVDAIEPVNTTNAHLMLPTLFRTLYCCGLRISEATSLLKGDFDAENGVFRVRHGKNDRERLVPVSASLLEELRRFLASAHTQTADDAPLFYTKEQTKYAGATIASRFKSLLWDIGVPYRGKLEGPRLHDLRHTFICHNIQRWSEQGIPIHTKLSALSKYVGHETVSSTQWYIRLTAEVYPHIREICERELAGLYAAILTFEEENRGE
jgi:integrase